jgi:hypothetical protein
MYLLLATNYLTKDCATEKKSSQLSKLNKVLVKSPPLYTYCMTWRRKHEQFQFSLFTQTMYLQIYNCQMYIGDNVWNIQSIKYKNSRHEGQQEHGHYKHHMGTRRRSVDQSCFTSSTPLRSTLILTITIRYSMPLQYAYL